MLLGSTRRPRLEEIAGYRDVLANRAAVPLRSAEKPRNRADDAYFEPLKRLALRPETELCLGLVHYTDGVDGTKQRLAMARKYAGNFSDCDGVWL